MMISRPASLAPILAALAIAGCSQEADEATPAAPEAPASAPAASQPTAAAPGPSETTGGDGSAITLSGLTAQDLEAVELRGELACAFVAAGDQVLLHAAGHVASSEPAVGVVKVTGYVERVAAPGGFDGMLRGATFAGQGKTVVIEVTGEPMGGGESPARPATLTYQRADGAERAFPGQWNCGP